MFNRKYKKGMADAAKAYEAFGKKQEDAINHVLMEVRQGKREMEKVLQEFNGNIDGLYDYLQSKEKASLYTIYTPFDIKELEEAERLFLVGALYRLAMDKVPTENQQNYLRAVQKYLDVKDVPFGVDLMAIENVEDLSVQKAMLQTVMEFLYLQDEESYDATELQQDFLDTFSVNMKGRKEIVDRIELLYTATGAQGLAEKYGYVPECEDFCGEELLEEPEAEMKAEISGDIADIIFRDMESKVFTNKEYLETQDYYVYYTYGVWNSKQEEGIYALNKRDGSRKLVLGKKDFPGRYCRDLEKGSSYKNLMTAFFSNETTGDVEVCLLNIESNMLENLGISLEIHSNNTIALNGQYILWTTYIEDKVICYDRINGIKYTLTNEVQGSIFCTDENLYFITYDKDDDSKSYLIEYSFERRKEKKIVELPFGGHIKHSERIAFYDDKVYLIKGEYPVSEIAYVDLKQPVMEYQRVDVEFGPPFRKDILNAPNGWVYLRRKNEPFAIEYFDFSTMRTITIAHGCGYKSWYKGRLFEKSCWLYHNNSFMVVGSWVYFRKGEDGPFCKVSVDRPMELMVLGES